MVWSCLLRQASSILACWRNRNSEEQGLADIDEVKRQLVDMQTQLAYQEDTVRDLNDALASQQQEILVLRRQLQLLKQRQDEQGADAAAGPGDEKPPHY